MTTHHAVERTRGGFDPAETIVLVVGALAGLGANAVLAATVATFLYALATLL